MLLESVVNARLQVAWVFELNIGPYIVVSPLYP